MMGIFPTWPRSVGERALTVELRVARVGSASPYRASPGNRGGRGGGGAGGRIGARIAGCGRAVPHSESIADCLSNGGRNADFLAEHPLPFPF